MAAPTPKSLPPLGLAFLRWQCRVRQTAMRESSGRPGAAVMPALFLTGNTEPTGHIVTVLCKREAYAVTPEMQHIHRSTRDPAARRKKAIEFFSATYFQKARTFSDTLTATFPPASPGARTIDGAGRCTLEFEAYGQRFVLPSQVTKLRKADPLYQATWWHNALFNPDLPSDTVILGFNSDWIEAVADPVI